MTNILSSDLLIYRKILYPTELSYAVKHNNSPVTTIHRLWTAFNREQICSIWWYLLCFL